MVENNETISEWEPSMPLRADATDMEMRLRFGFLANNPEIVASKERWATRIFMAREFAAASVAAQKSHPLSDAERFGGLTREEVTRLRDYLGYVNEHESPLISGDEKAYLAALLTRELEEDARS